MDELTKRCGCSRACSCFAPPDFPDGWVSDHCRFRLEVVALLRSIERKGAPTGSGYDPMCPVCEEDEGRPHLSDCRLARLLDWAETWNGEAPRGAKS